MGLAIRPGLDLQHHCSRWGLFQTHFSTSLNAFWDAIATSGAFRGVLATAASGGGGEVSPSRRSSSCTKVCWRARFVCR